MSFRILLIKPNICVREGFDLQSKKAPPIGLAYLAGSLLKAGYEVKILDMVAESDSRWPFRKTHTCFGLKDEELINQIREYKPSLIGIGGFTSQYARVKEIVSLIKLFDPEIKIVLGGIHATAIPRDVMENTKTDFIIQGEGESGIVALAEALDTSEHNKIMEIDGIAYRDGEEIIVKPKLRHELDLDAIPWPAHSLLNSAEYIKDGVAMPIITSRSCPGRCTFCSVHLTAGGKWRARNPIDVADEIESLVATGYKTIALFDDASNVQPERIIQMCQEVLRRKLDVRLTFPGGLIINYITRDLLYWMKQAGAISLSLPVEHVNQYMRNTIIKKKLKMEKIQDVLNWCRELKILALVNFVVGMPGETEESLKEIVDFVKSNANRFDSLSAYIATPFPGTQLYTDCINQGLLVDPGKNDFLDFDLYTAHVTTKSIPFEVVAAYKTIIEQTFIESRGKDFPSQYIRKAIRKPDEETTNYIENVYFKNLGF